MSVSPECDDTYGIIQQTDGPVSAKACRCGLDCLDAAGEAFGRSVADGRGKPRQDSIKDARARSVLRSLSKQKVQLDLPAH